MAPASTWPVRADAFSQYRSGFEVRTSRLCRRVLTFHHFAEELGTADCLVHATAFAYSVKRAMINTGFMPGAGGTLQLSGNPHVTRVSVAATGLTPPGRRRPARRTVESE